MTSTKDKTGRSYEALTQRIFQEILAQDGSVRTIQVRHDEKVQGRSTVHQIDVLWEFDIGGIRYTTVVQCKDYAKPVEQGEILLFAAVLDDLPGQPRGIVVSRAGFQKGAVAVARHRDILLYELREPRDSDWDGCIKTICGTMHFRVPSLADVNLVADSEWARVEKERTEVVGPVEVKWDAETPLVDDVGVAVSTVGQIVRGMCADLTPCDRVRRRHVFNDSIYIQTGLAAFPRIRLAAIEATLSMRVIDLELKVDAGDFVAFVLKNIMDRAETRFGHDMKILGS